MRLVTVLLCKTCKNSDWCYSTIKLLFIEVLFDEVCSCCFLFRDLSFNELSGDIPFSISKLKQLEQL